MEDRIVVAHGPILHGLPPGAVEADAAEVLEVVHPPFTKAQRREVALDVAEAAQLVDIKQG